MKKAWMALLGATVLLAAAFFVGGAMLQQGGEEPVLTQRIQCIVLEKTARELIVQSAQRTVEDVRTVRIVPLSRRGEAVSIDDAVQVGDLVSIETVLHCDNTETLRAVEVLSAGALSQQEARIILEEAQTYAGGFSVKNRATQAADNKTDRSQTQDDSAPAPQDESMVQNESMLQDSPQPVGEAAHSTPPENTDNSTP